MVPDIDNERAVSTDWYSAHEGSSCLDNSLCPRHVPLVMPLMFTAVASINP